LIPAGPVTIAEFAFAVDFTGVPHDLLPPALDGLAGGRRAQVRGAAGGLEVKENKK
jgi:hypothetical protein